MAIIVLDCGSGRGKIDEFGNMAQDICNQPIMLFWSRSVSV
jgi:hypothetical protein